MNTQAAKSQLSKIALNISLLTEIKEAKHLTKEQHEKTDKLYAETISLMYETAAEFIQFKGEAATAAALRSKKGINQQEANEATNAALKGLKNFLGLNIPDKLIEIESTVIGQPLTRKKNVLQK